MIFVTVGSQLPFDRLVEAVAAWARERNVRDIFFQTGGGSVDLSGFEHADFVSPAEAASLFQRADVVVSHVGMGTIISCLEQGKPLIALPRTAALGETRNDHQLASARGLADRQGLCFAWKASDLPALLDRINTLQGGARASADASPELVAAVRAFIHE